ncbi:MAG TPA: hypothetical protein VGX76_14980 [Pirellulales bacterium]|nr:hypothetical protein [Pirellulales bacterium]
MFIFNAGSKYPSTGGNYGGVTLSGNGTFSLSAPASGAAYAGIMLDQPADNTHALSISGNATTGMTGTVYAPGAVLSVSGNAKFNGSLDVNTLSLSGNSVANALTSDSATTYTSDQIRTAYGVNNLALDGTDQTIAIVEAYDDPSIFQSLDAFDQQFGAALAGPTLYQQYGPASSFLTVLNQDGQTASLPAADPTGGWATEEALDVEWTHAMAPGAQIIVVEANSQALADLMAGVVTAANQSAVSVVSMSWGFQEGQAVLQQDEAIRLTACRLSQRFAVSRHRFLARPSNSSQASSWSWRSKQALATRSATSSSLLKVTSRLLHPGRRADAGSSRGPAFVSGTPGNCAAGRRSPPRSGSGSSPVALRDPASELSQPKRRHPSGPAQDVSAADRQHDQRAGPLQLAQIG